MSEAKFKSCSLSFDISELTPPFNWLSANWELAFEVEWIKSATASA
jgi:hypothetical protein